MCVFKPAIIGDILTMTFIFRIFENQCKNNHKLIFDVSVHYPESA